MNNNILEIMHKDRRVARIDSSSGRCKIYYYMMNIVDYLVGNTDRHWGNGGGVNNANNKPVSLHPLMDFNKTFNAYDNVDGSNCQTCFGKRVSQKDAALEAVGKIGLNQIKEIDYNWFKYFPEYIEIFKKRLEILNGLNG